MNIGSLSPTFQARDNAPWTVPPPQSAKPATSFGPSLYGAASSFSSQRTKNRVSVLSTRRDVRPLPTKRERYIHLNGRPYFYNKASNVVTSADLYDPEVRKTILAIRDKEIASHQPQDASQDLYIDWEMWEMWALPKKDQLDQWESGFISFSKGVAFTTVGNSKIHYCPRSKFWQLLEMFPMHHDELPLWAEAEFLTALTYGANERALDRKNTTFPFTDQQTERLVQIYKDLQDRRVNDKDTTVIPTLVWHIARVMYQIEESRNSYGYGTTESRMYRNVAHPKLSWKVSCVDAALVFVLLGAHTAYRKRLLSTRVKGEVYVPDFHSLMRSLLDEWADTNLLATVFVSANVAFLALPRLNSLQRTSSLASSLFAMMSIVAGVHHVWQHRGKTDVEYKEAHQYLHHVDHIGQELDLTVTACFLSLPLVSLLWSILSFMVAVAAFCFQESALRERILLATVLATTGFFAVCMLFFFWHIWRRPATSEPEDEYHFDLSLNVNPSNWTAAVGRKARELLRMMGRPDKNAVEKA